MTTGLRDLEECCDRSRESMPSPLGEGGTSVPGEVTLNIKTLKNRISAILKKESLYTQTLFMLSLLSLITIAAMFAFVSNIVVRNQKEKIASIYSDQLERISTDADILMNGIEQSLSELLHANSMVSLMVNPRLKSSSTGYAVVSLLANAAQQDPLVKREFLYLPYTEEVYSSVGNYVSLENSPNKEDIEIYLSLREQDRAGDAESETRLFFNNGELYLAGDMCVPNFIGAVICQIDTEAFYDRINGSSDDPTDFFILDRDRNILISAPASADKIRAVLDKKGTGDLLSDPEEGFIYTQSQAYGLICGLGTDSLFESVSPLTVILTLLPFIIAYGIFSLLYSRYVSKKVYAPFNRLMHLTGLRGQSEAADRNRGELEILEETIGNAMGESSRQRELLDSISSDVTEQLFRGILMMSDTDMDHIRVTMEGIGRTEYLTGKYQAMAVRIQPEEGRNLSVVEEGLYQKSLLAILHEQSLENGLIVPLYMDSETLAVLLCFTDDVSVLSIKREQGGLADNIERGVNGLPYSVIMGKGKIYNEITALKFSYREAAEELLVPEHEMENAENLQAAGFDRRYYRRRAEEYADIAEKAGAEEAEAAAGSIAAELSDSTNEHRRDSLEEVLEVLVERMINAHLAQDDIQKMMLRTRMETIRLLTDRDEIRGKIAELLSEIGRALRQNSGKSRYRYVDFAMEYIAAHYSDGNLSLDEVSRAVGISAPYLSGIFSEVNKGGFLAYLSSYRVEQAKKYLAGTGDTVAEIGKACGFNSAQSFSRVFRKQTGMSPGQYRDKMKET